MTEGSLFPVWNNDLLRPIARRMRQWTLVIFKPNPIAHIDIAMTKRTTFEMFGLA
jgi:hypothetical protein